MFWKYREMERQRDRFAQKFKVREAKNKSTERQTEIHKGRQMDTKTDNQKDKQTG